MMYSGEKFLTCTLCTPNRIPNPFWRLEEWNRETAHFTLLPTAVEKWPLLLYTNTVVACCDLYPINIQHTMNNIWYILQLWPHLWQPCTQRCSKGRCFLLTSAHFAASVTQGDLLRLRTVEFRTRLAGDDSVHRPVLWWTETQSPWATS